MSNQERKLTPAEQKRKAHFDKISEELEQNGYQKHDLTVGIVQANVAAIAIMLPVIVVAGWIFFMVNPTGSGSVTTDSGALLFSFLLLFLLFLLIVVHEAIHGLTWGLFAKNHFQSISFGVIWKALTPYCTCSEPLKKWQYIIGGAMPTLILGVLPAVIATALGQLELFALAELMLLSGGGDALIILKLLLYRHKNKEVLYIDHPYECGLVAFEKSNPAD